MEITLTRDQATLVRKAIESGRLESVEDAVTEALLPWEEREALRRRVPGEFGRGGRGGRVP